MCSRLFHFHHFLECMQVRPQDPRICRDCTRITCHFRLQQCVRVSANELFAPRDDLRVISQLIFHLQEHSRIIGRVF